MGETHTFGMVLGLGNPGRDYARTRHNVGFMILDRLASGAGFSFATERRWEAEVARHDGVVYCKPLSYMNASGRPARAVADFYQVPPSRTLVVLDDVALPLGRLRLRPGGRAGGHHGLQSVIDCFGTESVPRLRFGIGSPEHPDMVGHVLGKFSDAETRLLEEGVARAAEAIASAQTHGLEQAMNHFNQPAAPSPSAS
jgi:PTH1 family peptidyl-tRNA hydrolase